MKAINACDFCEKSWEPRMAAVKLLTDAAGMDSAVKLEIGSSCSHNNVC